MINPFKNKKGLGRGLSSLIGDSDIKALNNKISMEQLREQIVIATRQYAKRQRTWFRSKMKSWERYTIK